MTAPRAATAAGLRTYEEIPQRNTIALIAYIGTPFLRSPRSASYISATFADMQRIFADESGNQVVVEIARTDEGRHRPEERVSKAFDPSSVWIRATTLILADSRFPRRRALTLRVDVFIAVIFIEPFSRGVF